MIDPRRFEAALRALNAVLYLARDMAYRSEPGIADVLDDAEYLPLLMLSPKDETATFREYLVGMAERRAQFQIAVDRFDNDTALPGSFER